MPDSDAVKNLSSSIKLLLVVYLVALFVAAVHIIISVWPEVPSSGAIAPARVSIFWEWKFELTGELQLAFVAGAAGFLGGVIHAANSLAAFTGRRDDRSSWDVWYVLRPWIGGGLAILVFAALGIGLLVISGDAETGTIRPASALAIGGLAGFASKETVAFLVALSQQILKTAEPIGDELKPTDNGNGNGNGENGNGEDAAADESATPVV